MKQTATNKKALVILAAMAAISGNVFAAGVNNTVDPNAALYGAEAYGKQNVVASTATSAFAVGYNNTVSGDNSFVYGNANKATGTNAIAGGEYSRAAGRNSVAIGSSAQALQNDTFAIGSQARANGTDALAFGNGAYAENTATVAIGKTVKATGEGALAIGFNTEATARDAIAIGGNVKEPGDTLATQKTTASGRQSIALGYKANSKGVSGISIGTNSYSEGRGAVSIGSWSIASGDGATAVGGGHARADRAVVVGSGNADGKESVSMGSYSRVYAEGAVGIGRNVFIDDSATDSVVVGSSSETITKKNVTAIGSNTYSEVENSVALGTMARADEVVSTSSANIAGKTYSFAGSTADGTVSIGGKIISGYETDRYGIPILDDNGNMIPIVDKTAYRTITNVAAGRISDTSTDAINGSQLHAAVKAIEKNHQAAADAMAEAKKHVSVVAGDNVEVTTGTNANGGTEYKVATKKDVNLSSASFGSVSDPVHNVITKDGIGVFDNDVDTQYKANGMIVENRDNLDNATHDINGVTADSNGRHIAFTTDGIDAGSQIINNVKAGVNDTDAVNVKQLNDSISTESVVSDNQVDNIAAVRVLNGKSTGDKNAQYGVYVSRTTVDSIAKASNRFAGDDVIKVERWSAPSNVSDLTTFKYDGNKAAAKTPLTYKANGVEEKVMLSDGLNFTNGNNTTASIDANGVVKYDLNKDISVDSVTTGKLVADKANIAGVTIDNNAINAGGKTITNVARGINTNDAVTVGQLNDVRTAMTNGDAATLNRANAYTDSRVSETTAQNAALAALHPLDFNKHDKLQIATGVGNYKNKTSVALGAFYQPNENILLSVGATLGAHRNVVNAGATFRFGKHSEMNTDRHDALENKVKSLEETLADISAKYDELLKKVENK